jgi:molybdenum cofactor cytidylyltransferase
LEAGCDPVVVVTGSDSELVAEAVSGLNVKIVSNHDWDTGLASSLRSGIGAACAMSDCDAVLITLADQPRVTAASLRKLLGAFDAKHRIVAAEYSGTIGVPALFGREQLDRLMQTRGDLGAGPFLRSHRKEVTAIPLEEAALDIDTPADLAQLGDGAA